MKTKPKEAIAWMRQGVLNEGEKELLAFLDSLPDQFEIVEPGKVQVEWPKGMTRERLAELACRCDNSNLFSSADALRALAAIAPKKRTRTVNVWKHIHESEERIVRPTDWAPRDHGVWTKVNASPVEIED